MGVVAGIMAAKRTSDLIPLCHPLGLDPLGLDPSSLDPGSLGLLLKISDGRRVFFHDFFF